MYSRKRIASKKPCKLQTKTLLVLRIFVTFWKLYVSKLFTGGDDVAVEESYPSLYAVYVRFPYVTYAIVAIPCLVDYDGDIFLYTVPNTDVAM